MSEPEIAWLLIGFFAGMIVMHEMWRWLERSRARLQAKIDELERGG